MVSIALMLLDATRRPLYRFALAVVLGGTIGVSLEARSVRFRASWREDPATTMVIGWDQVSGSNPVFYFDETDHGKNLAAYRNKRNPDASVAAKAMNNHFVRLVNLKPATVYYFVVADSEGSSARYSFRTAPGDPSERLSIIAGGDSRNNVEARVAANTLVAKIRPHLVLFNGDMTAGDTGPEWQSWLDDWQATIGRDGRITPVLVVRGNHEASNKSLNDLFDVPQPTLCYSLSFGGNLLRIITLNTLIPAAGEQRLWLEQELKATLNTWKIVQYHHSIRPHTTGKPERDDLWKSWAGLFFQYRVDLAIESDSHVAKWTYPLRPSTDLSAMQGFVRDDEKGTVYIGEGCWGAPLRANDDDKKWTRNSGSFNHFNLLFIDSKSIEVRTVLTDEPTGVQENLGLVPTCLLPIGIKLWEPSNGGVLVIPKIRKPGASTSPTASSPNQTPTTVPANSGNPGPPPVVDEAMAQKNAQEWAKLPAIKADPVTGEAALGMEMPAAGNALIQVYSIYKKEMAKAEFLAVPPGRQTRKINLRNLPKGRYLVVVRAQGKALHYFQFFKE